MTSSLFECLTRSLSILLVHGLFAKRHLFIFSFHVEEGGGGGLEERKRTKRTVRTYIQAIYYRTPPTGSVATFSTRNPNFLTHRLLLPINASFSYYSAAAPPNTSHRTFSYRHPPRCYSIDHTRWRVTSRRSKIVLYCLLYLEYSKTPPDPSLPRPRSRALSKYIPDGASLLPARLGYPVGRRWNGKPARFAHLRRQLRR